ncbi:DUF6106 family protein [Hespellia stercorisuis]|uniref:Uncharacterized protein n=1 Tax=Hespellia stercorisuis DSM 15480 TaxID=1121950 RepID=A0A1M6NJX5_9FIRM|nr:DUF6106 family protein [Hespellia stercorisuis]SHJ96035.1 hypothetical protein SAMN02745243_01842 [Hespellia stercorisuis DSM 15480]
MNDTFCELLVSRKMSGAQRVLQILLIVLIAILVAGTMIIGFPALFLALILGIICYYLIFPGFHVEYEYSILNHEITIDKILNKSKRKSVISFDLKQAEIIAPEGSERLAHFNPSKTIDCSAGDSSVTSYVAVVPIENVTTAVRLSPDDDMLQHMKSFLPRTLWLS